jgi:uncharacterized protein (TIGR04255 family)
LRTRLEAELQGYLFLDSQRIFRHEVKMEKGKQPSQEVQDLGWKGIRFRSSDEKHITQFNRDGFAFSRIEPYIDWSRFTSEGIKLWNVFYGLAEPVEIHRIGLRFINRIILPPGELRFEDYIRTAPATPAGLDLPFAGYMHQDTLAVPGHPYAVNVIQTIQRPQAEEAERFSLILDIDVFTIKGFEPDEEKLKRRLEEMRWLKDKAFFGSITEKAKEMFR